MEFTCTMDNINEVAAAFWQQAGDRKVMAFHGQLGAGKTTFISALCRQKKVASTVGSPTFSIINEYAYPGGKMYHLDLYRLKDEAEAVGAGVEDCLYSGQICLVEWPERAPGIFPEDTVQVYIQAKDPATRTITMV